jgi:hypothetical protein
VGLPSGLEQFESQGLLQTPAEEVVLNCLLAGNEVQQTSFACASLLSITSHQLIIISFFTLSFLFKATIELF